MKLTAAGTLPALAAAACVLALLLHPPASERPDVVLISIDTLRADHLSAYGYARKTSPRIDAFAGEALLFEDCLSHASETRLAFSALMSGFLPHETAVMRTGAPSPQEQLLSVVLRRRGYRTAAVISNYVLRGSRGWNVGFDVFDDTMQEREAVRPIPERTAAATTDRAIEVLREPRKQPLFLWVHYQDPHGPYTPPRDHDIFGDPNAPGRPIPLNRGSLSGMGGIPDYQILDDRTGFDDYVARYDGEIHFTDGQVGRLLDELKRLGMYERALIVLTSDHGEGMGERDYYFAHGEEVHAPLVRVPLILKLGQRLRGRRSEPVQHLDLLPTLYRRLGIDADRRWRGRDLLAAPLDPGVERLACVAAEHSKLALAKGGFQIVHAPESGRDELYDLVHDPLARRDISGWPEHRQVLTALRRRLLQIRTENRTGLRDVGERPELTAEQREKLRALGYVQ